MANSASSPKSFPWVFGLAGLSAIWVGVGFGRFSFAQFIPALVQAGWFPPAQADYLGAANLVGYLVGSLAAGPLARRFSVPWLIRLSMLTVAAGFLACAHPGPFAWFAFWRFMVGVVGAFLMILAPPTLLAQAQESRRHSLRGLIFTGLGLGILFSAVALPFLLRFGLGGAWLGLGSLSLLWALVFWKAWPPPVSLLRGDEVLKVRMSRPIGILLFLYCASATGLVPCTVFWVDYLVRGLHLSLGTASLNWILFGLGSLVGPFVGSALGPKFGFQEGILMSLSGMAAANLLAIFSQNPWALALSAFTVGTLAMSIVSLVLGRSGQLAGLDGQREVWGWMTAAFSLTQALGAYAYTYLFDRTGSYHLLFGISAGVLLAGVLLGLWDSRHVKKD
ncbi:MAG TPA: YbfB/YjiJ family MFS transporter [bacterium]|nr:YbfB/YjiJ family MFS transporter [bacterium]